MALLGRDNNEDLNYVQVTEPCVVISSSHGNILEGTAMKDTLAMPGPIPTVATTPIPISEMVDMDRHRCVNHCNTLNEDVEKLFSMPEKFDIAALSSGSDLITSDRSEHSLNPQVMEKPFLEDVGVSSRHRRSTFPHQHHPLKAMRSKSLKQIKSPHEHKPKKKKKKKRKLKTPKSFPSRSAILSPTIHEVEHEEDHSIEDSSSESGDEDEVSYEYVDTGMDKNVFTFANDLFDTIDKSGSEDQIDRGITRQSSEPNDFKLDLEEDKADGNNSPAIILTRPSPIHFEHGDGSSSIDSQSLKQGNHLGSFSTEFTPTEEKSHLNKVWPTLADKVGFYIGDNESMGSQKSTPKKKVFYLGEETSLTSRQKSENGSQNSFASSISDQQQQDTDSAKSQINQDSSWRYLLSDDEPVLSPSASKEGAKSLLDSADVSKVKFHMGADSYTNLEAVDKSEDDPLIEPEALSRRGSKSSEGRPHKHRHHTHHHHHEHYKQEDLNLRRHKGSELHLDQKLQRVPTEQDEANLLHTADLDEMASHRLEDIPGIRRHKINRKKRNAMASIVHIGKSDRGRKKVYREHKKYDHSPHEVFVELDELYVGESREYEWREKARWIKFEEDVEEGAERWGKPHVASLSFHSLLELRRGLENGTMLLDIEATDLPSIVNHIIDSMIIHDQIKAENKGNILRTLLLKHK